MFSAPIDILAIAAERQNHAWRRCELAAMANAEVFPAMAAAELAKARAMLSVASFDLASANSLMLQLATEQDHLGSVIAALDAARSVVT